MTISELYINGLLCDLGSDFGVRLNRQFLNPGELSMKDAQYSYSVTLPSTSNNHAIFGYVNVEEVSGKFNREYSAELIVNSVRVFVGRFRLSEITREQYKGNLYTPAPKTAKDIFGDRKLTENPPFRIDFGDFAESISRYNVQASRGLPPAIFPYTLYGVLPKIPGADGKYSDSTTWDDTVRISIQDFPASINPLSMLRHIFEGAGYTLNGSAFDDERLMSLYMSYKNPIDYVQPWNYGRNGLIRLRGEWSNVMNTRTGTQQLERGVIETSPEDGSELYACDLFDSTNVSITEKEDPGGNLLYSETSDETGRTWAHVQLMIPASGYYKIRLASSTQLHAPGWLLPRTDPVTGIPIVASTGPRSGYDYMRSAIKLLRDRKKGDFAVSSSRMDGALYKDNLPQNSQYDESNTPKYLPKFEGADAGSIVFVDLAQNENHVAGFQCGKRNDDDVIPTVSGGAGPDSTAKITAAKPAVSWDGAYDGDARTALVIDSPGYMRYALEDSSGSESTVWTQSGKYAYDLQNAPGCYARKGFFEGEVADSDRSFDGDLSCVVWLEAGELLTLADVSDRGEMQPNVVRFGGWVAKSVSFDLTITPFQIDTEWLKIDEAGTATGVMNWEDPVTFDTTSIDLVKFLPADMKTDDFIDNFCKAFNLRLTQVGDNSFELNVKQSRGPQNGLFVNLDGITAVRNRSNTPLDLPSAYQVGFTVDTDEEGYVESEGNDGGGEFQTGALNDKVVEQKSNFSYNWFKNITKVQTTGDIVLPLAVISKAEVWTLPYAEAMQKRDTCLALRFWYADGLLNDTGAAFDFNGSPLSVVKVSGQLPGRSILSYENRRWSILDNYFTLPINGSSHYTEVEGRLTPDQYERIGRSVLAMFNGDLYHVAELSGYDPSGRNKTRIKLIRLI